MIISVLIALHYLQFYTRYILIRAVDPHSFFADPDPDVFLNADPDPGALLMRIRIQLK